jgi:5-methylcytosine-specific restriction protein A
MSEQWSNDELKGAVVAYLEMRSQFLDGKKFVKKDYYRDLARRFGRTEKSYEYRMQNISHVLSLQGREWVSGLRPAANVGSNVICELEKLISEVEGVPNRRVAEFETSVKEKLKGQKKTPPAGSDNPPTSRSETVSFVRDPAVKAWVLAEANGKCELCGTAAPFVRDDGTPFLEVHHVRTLADKGSDRIQNAVALCPNCHRALHYARGRSEMVERLFGSVSRLEKETGIL